MGLIYSWPHNFWDSLLQCQNIYWKINNYIFKCKYSATNARKTLFKFSTVVMSTLLRVSVILCQTSGNGTVIKWRTGTPLFKNGLWSSSGSLSLCSGKKFLGILEVSRFNSLAFPNLSSAFTSLKCQRSVSLE